MDQAHDRCLVCQQMWMNFCARLLNHGRSKLSIQISRVVYPRCHPNLGLLFLISLRGMGIMIPILEDTTIADVLKTFEDYYTKKDYLNALLVLQKGGKEISPKVKHYNLGTVYAKMQNWPMARYHFLLA